MISASQFSRLQTADERWPLTVYAVEANSAEHALLWEKYHKECDWQDISSGFSHVVGILETADNQRWPVNVSLTWSMIEGHPVCFYDAISMVVHYGWVLNYIESKCPKNLEHTSTWIPFNDVLRHIRQLNAERTGT